MRVTTMLSLALLATLGCTGVPSNSDDDAADQIDSAGKADGDGRPLGTFRNPHARQGQFVMLALTEGLSFYRQLKGAAVEGGTFAWSKSGSTRYVRFYTPDNEELDRYAYRMTEEGDLELRAPDTSEWQMVYFAPQRGYCGDVEDCRGQPLARPRCMGTWTCTANTCDFDCDATPDPPADTTGCEAAGGACVALAPGACANGVIGDATQYSCGGGLGVMCCLPAAPAAPTQCEQNGGECVGLAPGACATGYIGEASRYSCGGGLGLQCCLP